MDALKERAVKTSRISSVLQHVLPELENFCGSLQVGDRIPSLPELMVRFSASERVVLRALDRLQSDGVIVRRQGAGTFVADRAASGNPSSSGIDAPPFVPAAVTDRRTIVAVRHSDSSYFDHCVNALFRHVNEAGLSLVCKIIGSEADLSTLVPASADDSLGFIVFRYDLAPLARSIQAMGCRVVIIGAPPAGVLPDVPSVYGDHVRGGYLATKHLIDLGHRRIAVQAPSLDYQQKYRWIGHEKAISEASRNGLEISQRIVFADQIARWGSDAPSVTDYFGASASPTAIIAWNDSHAAEVAVALLQAGIKVPTDVSIVGYDNLPESRFVQPQLTTVDHSIDWQLNAALDLLTNPIAPPQSHTTVVMPSLVARQSTSTPASHPVSATALKEAFV